MATEQPPPELHWIQLQHEITEAHKDEESMTDKLIRKTKENPFVPIGCLATTAALSYGLWSFRHGKKKTSQYMMRARIVAQGFTIVAFMVGLAMTAAKSKQNE